MADCDVLVLGAGHNGLGISGLLAKEGLKVINIEKNDFVGGLASNAHFWPGYTHNTGAWWLSFNKIQPVWNALGLDRYGCELFNPPTRLRTIIGQDEKAIPHHMLNSTELQMNRIHDDFGQDAVESFNRFYQYFEPFSMGIKPMINNPPISIGQLMDRMPSTEAKDILNQVFYGTAADIIDEYFPDKERLATIRGGLTASACYGFWGGPMTPGSNLRFAYHMATHAQEEDGSMFKFLKGGIGKLSDALAKALQDFGGQLILNSEVKKVLLEKGKAAGVQLANGDVITAKYVISSLDATNTFLRLVGEENIPPFVTRQIKRINYRSHFLQAFCVCSGLPEFKGKFEYFNTEGWRWSVDYLPSLEYCEQCWDDVKLGRIPENPTGAYSMMSVIDPSLAPAGKYAMSMFTHHTWPVGVPAEKVNEVKETCFQRLVDTFCRFAPNFREIIDDHVVMAPPDYEIKFHNTAGDWTHGEVQLSQLFNNRPVTGMANYKVPFINNMWLCGSSCHPGPGVTFIPATNCFNAFKKEIGLKKK